MLLDKQNMFSDQQDLAQAAASYLSTNTIDQGAVGTTPFNGSPPADIGRSRQVQVMAEITETFTSGGAATLQVQLVSADNAALSSNLTVLSETPAYALAALTQGKQIPLAYGPGVTQRYLGMRYVIGTAATTAGKVSAGLVMDRQTNGI